MIRYGIVIHHHWIFHLVETIKHGFVKVGEGPFWKSIADRLYCFPGDIDHIEIVLMLWVKNGVHPRPSSGRAIDYQACSCLLYTSDAADERSSVDLGGR